MDISIEWFNDNSGFVAFIAAMVALLVGIIAAGISIWNTRITQRGLRLQYQPELLIKPERRQGIFYIIIENIGSGTAYGVKYNQELIDFIREWADQRGEMTGNDMIDSVVIGTLKSGACKTYTITPKYIQGDPQVIQIPIKISYTDIFKKFKGKTDTIVFFY